jgi:transposase
MVRIGEDSCEKLEVIPASIRVRRHVRPKYACHACEGSGDESRAAVRIAPAPVQLLPRSIASPALVAYIMVGKFCDSLPFYRQEKQFARIGVELSRQDMANWSIAVFERLRGLRELMRGQIRQGPLVQIDETTVQVMGEPGRPNTSKSYMWVFLGGSPGQPVVDYQYHPSRSGKIPLNALRGYQGFIQTDGYDGYEELGSQPGIFHVGCWAHARRKFFEAREVSKTKSSADAGLASIDALFKIERTLREQDLTPKQFTQRRREQAELVLEKLHVWLEERDGQVPPSTTLGKAIGYTTGQWTKLIRYLDSPLLGPDNNACERAIRPFVLGRKNWLLSGSPTGAEASAAWYSLIETAKLNGIEPYLYLRYILERLPDNNDPANYGFLLPWNIPKESLMDFESGRLA